ncbi:signal peptidase I [Bacillus sinesaloumensis]|uniref:signal peptidase I n=1 Tax=Litchfieldia sinesaloumensis TaxID=1926280 RepID=UPI0011520732|nr:signal peptidase I [Bacillus sinesaloumensis]
MKNPIFKWVGNIAFVLFVVLSIAIIFSLLLTKNQQSQPSIFGYSIMTVLSGSMEPLLEPGDIIFVEELDPNQVQMNDVITYRNGQQTFVTHRVIDIIRTDGQLSFQTKGDANNVEDQELVSPNQVVGALKFHIPKVGHIVNEMKNPLAISIVFAIMIAFYLIKRIRVLSMSNQEQS